MKFDYGQVVLVSDKIGISPRKTEAFLTYLWNNDRERSIGIQRALGIPTSVIHAFGAYFDGNVVHNNDVYYLSPEGRKYAEDMIAFRAQRNERMREKIPEITTALERIETDMHKSKRKIDQVRVTPKSVARRVGFLYDRGWLEEKSIMLMGDNDITSIGLAMTGYPKRITVFDIDKDLIAFISSLSADQQLGIECKKYDARSKFPHEEMKKSDVAVTDPPYAPDGFDLFIQRCIQGIQTSNGTIVISYGFSDRSKERAIPIQDILTKRGLVLEEIVPSFNRYFAAQIIGCQSNLYLCRTTPQTTDEDRDYDGDMYTFRRPRKRSRRDHKNPLSVRRDFSSSAWF